MEGTQRKHRNLCIAILDSGNYALNLLNILEKRKLFFEFTSIPCSLAKAGCGYCIKLPAEYVELLIQIGKENGLPVREVYEIIPQFLKNKYIKIYENPSRKMR